MKIRQNDDDEADDDDNDEDDEEKDQIPELQAEPTLPDVCPDLQQKMTHQSLMKM